MKKIIILLNVLILILSISSINASLFGPETADCELFSIEVPKGYYKSDGYDPFGENGFYLAQSWKDDDNITDRTLWIYEVESFDDYNRTNAEKIIKSYSDGDIKANICFDSESIDNNHANYTHIEFSKDGHHYVIENYFEGNYEDIDIKKDVELVKNIKNTLKHK